MTIAHDLIMTRWTKAHKLAMCVMYDQADLSTPEAFTAAIYNQLAYLAAKDEEARLWASMTNDDYLEYLVILERYQGDA